MNRNIKASLGSLYKEDNENSEQNGYMFNTYFSRNIVYITNLTPFFIGIFIGFLFLCVQFQYFLQ